MHKIMKNNIQNQIDKCNDTEVLQAVRMVIWYWHNWLNRLKNDEQIVKWLDILDAIAATIKERLDSIINN